MTTDGRVVTDPVYSSVSRPGWYDGSSWHTLDMLVLSRAETAPAQSPGGTKAVLAVAAADGSWVSDFTYYYASGGPEGLFLIAADGVSLLDGNGKPLYSWTAAQMGFSQEEYARYLSESAAFDSPVGRMWQDYACIGWADGTVRLLQLKTGEVETWPSDDWWRYQERGASSLDWEVVDQGETTLLRRGEETYTIAQSVGNGYAEVLSGLVCFTAQGSVYGLDGRQVLSLGPDWSVYFLQDSLTRSQTPPLLAAQSRVGSGARRAYYRLDGTFLMRADNTESWYRQETLVGGLLEVLDLNTASYYNPETMECVFRTYLNFQGD
ncbi:hypothetical protein SDC9_118577 [bioreactor metagenome]|uniref:Uncharacterized protein n=1 Tax=bioreactor metagenome TaxID=1076179 RepID=A0A645C1U9_9ZZZZ